MLHGMCDMTCMPPPFITSLANACIRHGRRTKTASPPLAAGCSHTPPLHGWKLRPCTHAPRPPPCCLPHNPPPLCMRTGACSRTSVSGERGRGHGWCAMLPHPCRCIAHRASTGTCRHGGLAHCLAPLEAQTLACPVRSRQRRRWRWPSHPHPHPRVEPPCHTTHRARAFQASAPACLPPPLPLPLPHTHPPSSYGIMLGACTHTSFFMLLAGLVLQVGRGLWTQWLSLGAVHMHGRM